MSGESAVNKGLHEGITDEDADEMSVGYPLPASDGNETHIQYDGKVAEMGGGNDSGGGQDYNIELPSPRTKNESSVAEKGTTKGLDIHLPLPISQSNSLHFQAIGKM